MLKILNKTIAIIVVICFFTTTTFQGLSFAEQPTVEQLVGKVDPGEVSAPAEPPTETPQEPTSTQPPVGGESPLLSDNLSQTATALERFMPDPFTGMATTSIPIAIPPGRKGIQPNISLTYSSSSANGLLGVGWNFNLGYIERSTKDGVPTYNNNSDTFIFNSSQGSSELVSIGSGEYRAKNENEFMRFIFNENDNKWQVTDKNGTKFFFGSEVTGNSKLNVAGGTFRWHLDKVRDTSGNYFSVTYINESNQSLYPDFIEYSGNEIKGDTHKHKVVFTWQNRQDPFNSYRSGSLITTSKILTDIRTYVDEGNPELSLARHYIFTYELSDRTQRSLLKHVDVRGKDDLTSLPRTDFSYQEVGLPTYQYAFTNPETGDNLWSARVAGGYDRGHDNYGPVPPPGFDVGWSEVITQSSYNNGCHSWEINSTGNLSMGGCQDSCIWFWTFLYVQTPRTISFSTSGGDVVGVWLNGNYSQNVGSTWNLQAGYNLVEITGYNQNQGYGYSINSPAVSSQVDLMNTTQLVMPQLSADFNADGLTDLGTFFPTENGRWEVALSTGPAFLPDAPKTTWITGFGDINSRPLLGDFNGDAKTDICVFNSGNWRLALSNGSQFIDQGNWITGFGSGQDPITGDFDGDGKTDIGYFEESGGNWHIALSTGSGFGSETTWISGFGGSNTTPLTGDFNADGLVDILAFNKSSGEWRVALSDGDNFVDYGSWASGFATDKDPVLVDFNGDGLTDIGYFDKSNGKVIVRASTGSSFSPTEQEWLTGITILGNNAAFQSGDFNGDGLPDPYIFDPYIASTQLGMSTGELSDLISQINNSVGATLDIDYLPSTQYDNTGDDDIPDLPFSVPTIFQTRTSDGQGNTYLTTYFYKDGAFDIEDKEFRGFGYTKVTDAEGNYTETYIHQDDILKGKPYLTQTKDIESALFTKTENTWSYTETFLGSGSYFAYLSETHNYTYEKEDVPKHTKTTFLYDIYGNSASVYNFGDVDVTGDEREVITEYTYNTSDWIVSLPYHQYILDNTSQKVKENWLYYDNNPNYTDLPIRGLLTKQEDWLYNPIIPQEEIISNTFSFDDYGNLISTTDAELNTTTTTYDETYHIYPVLVINALGHTLQSTYDPLTGQLLTSTDPNNQTTQSIYDPLGRLSQVIGPLDQGVPAVIYSYDLDTFPTKITKQVKSTYSPVNYLTTYQFYDGLGRIIQTKSPAEDDPQTGQARQIVLDIVIFDSRGQVKEKYLPIFVSESSDYVNPEDYPTPPKASLEYDTLGRATKLTNPDNSYSEVTYQPWIKTLETPVGEKIQKNKEHYDAYGNLIKVEEFNGTETYTTTYEYDTLGNLTKVRDNQGNETIITYDTLSRKIRMQDPDMGTWNYTYDKVGNLLTQTDAKNQTINFVYDDINRLTLKYYPSYETVTYIYDSPETKPNIKGRLSKVIDSSGFTEFFYDEVGREIQSTKRIYGTNYTVHRGYDAMDRLTSLTYPDGGIVYYEYNLQGQIERIYKHTGYEYVSNVDYAPTNQITKIVYGNGNTTTYEYDPLTLRLSHLKTNEGALQDLQYNFDEVGNLTAITDSVNSSTQTFQYDDLNRLTQAVGSYGTFNYSYDSIGNIIEKEGVTFTYNPYLKPHAVRSTSSGLSFSYDANGNMTRKGLPQSEVIYTYNYDNRLIEVEGSFSQIPVLIPLVSGWNFISLPIIPDDSSVSAVLAPLAGNYDQVSRYNPDTDRFESYIGDLNYDDFTTFEYGKGYEIHLTSTPQNPLLVEGQWPSSRDVLLREDWNLIVNPNLEYELPVEFALNGLDFGTDYNLVEEYILGTNNPPQFNEYPGTLSVLRSGKGYFINCLNDVTWNIPQNWLTQFSYDGDGGRVKKTESRGSITKTTTYIGSLYEITQETDQPTLTTRHIYLGRQKICSVKTDYQDVNYSYYHSDHLGSSNIITDENGVQVALYEYTPFGSISNEEGNQSTNYLFTGQELDSTGLYFFGARYYDPEIGRFITPDTISQIPSDPQTLNRYSYCRNNPLKYVDPAGRWFWFALILGAFIGGVAAGFQSNWNWDAILVGMIIGAISGVIGGGIGQLASGLDSIVSSVLGGMAGGVSGGILNAAYYGGDIMQGALMGAAYGALGGLAFGSISQLGAKGTWNWKLGLLKVGLSGIAGGGISEMAGGTFLEGFAFAAAIAGADFVYRAVTKQASSEEWATKEGKDKLDENGNLTQEVWDDGSNNVGANTRPGQKGFGKFIDNLFGETGPVMEGVGKYGPYAQPTARLHDRFANFFGAISKGIPLGDPIAFFSLTLPTIPPSYVITVLGYGFNQQPGLIGTFEVYGEEN